MYTVKILVLFFISVLWQALYITQANARCTTTPIEKTLYHVQEIIDGDTIITTNNLHIRFIGINTPEKAKKPSQKYGHEHNQPLANEAKIRLTELIDNKPIYLAFDKKKKDNYKRLLAHPFTMQGINITETLLREGYGFAIVIAPNTTFTNCYFSSEKKARQQKLGVWQTKISIPISATQLHTTQSQGFIFVHGIVENIQSTSKGVWVDLYGKMSFLILHKNMQYFNNMSDWQSKNITVRGWIIDRGKKNKPWQKQWMMMVSHPHMVELNKIK